MEQVEVGHQRDHSLFGLINHTFSQDLKQNMPTGYYPTKGTKVNDWVTVPPKAERERLFRDHPANQKYLANRKDPPPSYEEATDSSKSSQQGQSSVKASDGQASKSASSQR